MDIYARAFDQTNSSGIPYRYASAGSIDTCPSTDIEDSATLLGRAKGLYGNNYEKKITNQVECKPNTFNAGNWYNFPAATAGSKTDSGISYPYDTKNSICPKGWQLPPNAGNKSYYTLIYISSGIYTSPLSFVNFGYYDCDYGSLSSRGSYGLYWSSTAYNSISSYNFYFSSGNSRPQHDDERAYGSSIRCVSR